MLLLSADGERVCEPSSSSVMAMSLLMVGAIESVVERMGVFAFKVGLSAARIIAPGLGLRGPVFCKSCRFSSSGNSSDDGVKDDGDV